MPYRVELETKALKEFRALPKERRALIGDIFDDLQRDPRPPGAKKLSGVDGYRIRSGDYRILYTIADGPRLVRVFKVGHRRDVYRR